LKNREGEKDAFLRKDALPTHIREPDGSSESEKYYSRRQVWKNRLERKSYLEETNKTATIQDG